MWFLLASSLAFFNLQLSWTHGFLDLDRRIDDLFCFGGLGRFLRVFFGKRVNDCFELYGFGRYLGLDHPEVVGPFGDGLGQSLADAVYLDRSISYFR